MTVSDFTFGNFCSRVIILDEIPPLSFILSAADTIGCCVSGCLLVCDTNTLPLVQKITAAEDKRANLCVLPPGEAQKNWAAVETILKAAVESSLGRDGLFIGIGGGVITDLCAFAASIYMRGAKLCLVSTTLLGMADASLGGKTGFDLCGIKNLAGTFYPARLIFMPLESLASLPLLEWKSGMAECIKTAILDTKTEVNRESFFKLCVRLSEECAPGKWAAGLVETKREDLRDLITRCVELKGRIVEADPTESGTERALLNMGHTFAHALEASLGFGAISHGEAVAWGIACACELGIALGTCPKERAQTIQNLLAAYDYEIARPYPLLKDTTSFMRAMGGDKKKKAGTIRFVVPGTSGACLTPESFSDMELIKNSIVGIGHHD
ncbi:3-dehydroquinate synthase [Breznakiellaceae bacterium SP9]